jgi:hypothetical protein
MANLTIRSTKGSPLTHEELDGNFEYFTGSIDAINASTSSFLTSASTSSFLTSASTGSFLTNASTGSFLTSASTGSFLTSASTGSFLTSASTGSFLTSASTGSFITSAQTASLNISNTLYTVNTALSASTTSSATTSICSYGVNVFEYVTPTDFATKLPQPTTGKSVRIVNNGSTFLKIFPSNIGGHINNLPINEPAILPPDGNLYEFICIENPLPGAWTFSAPATGQYDSGEIEVSITAGIVDGGNPVVVAYNSSKYGTVGGFNGGSWGYSGKFKSTVITSNLFTMGGYNGIDGYLAFRPDTPWKGISKIKVYTNLITTTEETQAEVILAGGGQADHYILGGEPTLNHHPISFNSAYQNDHISLLSLSLNNTITGTAVTGSTEYTSANIGDPGTLWAEKVAYSDEDSSNVRLGPTIGTTIGNKLLDSAFPYPFTSTTYYDANGNFHTILRNDPCELFLSSYISFQIQPFAYDFDYGIVPDFKFRFIIEYYQ